MPKAIQKHFCFSTSWVRRKGTTITRLWQFFRPPIDGDSVHLQSSTTDISEDLQTILLYRIASQMLGPSQLIPIS